MLVKPQALNVNDPNVWLMLQYVGNAVKDLISAPRPFGAAYKGNVVRLIGTSELEANVNAQVSAVMNCGQGSEALNISETQHSEHSASTAASAQRAVATIT